MSNEEIKKQLLARWQIVVAMTTFGTLGLFVRNIQLASAETAFWRGIIAFVVLFLFMLYSKNKTDFTMLKKSIWKLFLSGGVMGINWILFFEAYNHTTVALTTLSYYFAPTVVIIASSILFREKLNVKQVICFLASTAGLVLIIGVSSGGGNDLVGILYGLGAALLYAIVVLFNKSLGEIHGIVRTWLQFASAVLVLGPYVYYTCGFQVAGLSSSGLVNLLIVGVFHTGVIYYLYFSSLAVLKGQQAAILSYIDPLVAVIVSVFILGESITILQLTGGVMILVFTLVNEIKISFGRG